MSAARACLVACGLLALRPAPGAAQQPVAPRDGQHDFDFEIGTWKTHLSRLAHPLTGSTTWVTYDGTTLVSKVWNDRANLAELEVDGTAGHIEGASLRLYNPDVRQWSLSFANSAVGTMATPTIGEFIHGRGEFYDQEMLNGRAIFVRFIIQPITPDSIRFEQAYSADGGKTWEVNWIAIDTRVEDDSVQGTARQQSDTSRSRPQQRSTKRDGQHDFDFEIGTWKVHNSRLLHPSTGSTTWIQFEGTSVARKVWNGRADLLELESDPPAGHAEGLILRLYNPQSHQWSIVFASSRDGTLSQPAIGEFKKGRGEFLDLEHSNGRTILARSVLSDITPRSYRLEQSFSDDGGKTWEVNWISVHTRVGASGRD